LQFDRVVGPGDRGRLRLDVAGRARDDAAQDGDHPVRPETCYPLTIKLDQAKGASQAKQQTHQALISVHFVATGTGDWGEEYRNGGSAPRPWWVRLRLMPNNSCRAIRLPARLGSRKGAI
jgi:hypothetical protein